jgi:ABC-type phosphate/phosphonate transport system substrate-binding protein
MIVVRKDSPIRTLADLAGTTAAVNSVHSQSGYWALRAAIAETRGAPTPARAILSGGHRRSLQLVAAGNADLAAIDAVCWALAGRHETETRAQLRVLAASPSAPGLPLISASGTPPSTIAALRTALGEALHEPSLRAAREALFLADMATLSDSAYDRITELAALGATLDFPTPAE